MAVFIGLFIAFVPLPSQMLMAAVLAVLLRVNLPLSVLLVWVSNPITMPPLFYMAYKVGFALIGDSHAPAFHFQLSWQWLSTGLATVWQPFLLGCFVCGLFLGLLGSALTRVAWRWHVVHLWNKRRLRRSIAKK